MDRPHASRDLDWDAERARAFAGEMIEIWTELLGSLRHGPVVPPGLGARQVREALALDGAGRPRVARAPRPRRAGGADGRRRARRAPARGGARLLAQVRPSSTSGLHH